LYLLKTGVKYVGDSFHLYCIEKENHEQFGEAILKESTENELKHCSLNKGSTSFDLENILNSDIKLDLVFIDANHHHPWPIIDLLHILPFLHEGSIVILHDVVDNMDPNGWGPSFIFLLWGEEKYRSYFLDNNLEPAYETNLGCIEIPKDKKMLYDKLLKIVKIPYRANHWKSDEIYLGISEKDIKKLQQFMMKFYDEVFTKEVVSTFYKNLEEYKKTFLESHLESKFFEYLFMNTLKYDETFNILNSKLRLIVAMIVIFLIIAYFLICFLFYHYIFS
jgi:hypothetical protein